MPTLSAHVVATGHHQPAGVIGLRTSMIRFAGWTLQLIVIYLDSNFEIGQGPNKERTEQALQCVVAAKVPWHIFGDFNRCPEEVANSAWCKFLRGVVLTRDVAFTCTNTSQAGGSLIDFAAASRDLAPKLTLRPILHCGLKPHVGSIRVHIAGRQILKAENPLYNMII